MTTTGTAFIPGDLLHVEGAPGGALSELRFAAKDLFDVAGHVTGCGNPDWRRTHEPAEVTAEAVSRLLEAGADLLGKTITDELAFSLEGRNFHYGTPRNPAAEGCIPGGSSCGSASAVAAEQVDFSLGTDTGGSVRIPAALCGLYGLRPSHGSVSLAGVMPFAPSFDTVGWFARGSELLRRVGEVLLPPDSPARAEGDLGELVIAEDLMALADPEVAEAFEKTVEAMRRAGRSIGKTKLEAWTGMHHEEWTEVFRTLQGREITETHEEWIEATQPQFGPDIAYRFEWARSIARHSADTAAPQREVFAARLAEQLKGGGVLCFATAPTVAPKLSAPRQVYVDYRRRTLISTAISGLSGCPQVSLPVPSQLRRTRMPVGFSLLAEKGRDRDLLAFAEIVARQLRPYAS